MVAAHCLVLVAQDGTIHHIAEDAVVKEPAHQAVAQLVLGKDVLQLHEEAEGAKDVEVVRHADDNGRFAQVHHE